ncbi:hypothetical protein TNCV_3637191 [Trichonephila clavipes]|nr:hypothetical protein TNCV_3637191 [Trichonephila clavipes]
MRWHGMGIEIQIQLSSCGRGSLDVKVMNSWSACHEFEPSTAEDPPCRGCRCTLNIARLNCPPVGEV